ncbi:MAG: hypothetical protein H7Y33_11955, partial [Cytophagales bacterium]|nr:hypothetical protein [Rhizobacter sp.]
MLPPAPHTTPLARLAVPSLLLLMAALPAQAQTTQPPPALQECAAMGAAADRLAC